MSIYDVVNSVPAATLAQNQWNTNTALARLIGENLNALIDIYQKGFNIVNANPYGLSVTDVVGGVGASDWQKFYTEAVWLKSVINHCKPGTIVDPIGASEITVASSVENPTGGTAFNLTATVNPVGVTGMMTFLNGLTVLGTSPIDNAAGTATLSVTLATGSYEITASFNPDSNFCANSGTFIIQVA